MPVFVSTTFAAKQSSVIKTIRLLTEQGIFNIELGSIHKNEDNLNYKLQDKGCNYIIHNFFPPVLERFILNISSKDERIRIRSVEFIKQALDFAVKLGASIYTIHPGFLVEPTGESRSKDNYDFEFLLSTHKSLITDYIEGYEIFLRSLKVITGYIKDKSIRLAVETQGSVSKRDFILFSRPEDFRRFFRQELNNEIGINLNLGHLNLAAGAWGFDKYEAVEMLKPRIVALEVSHNDGIEDSHQALRSDGWYMHLFQDSYFKKIPVIFEGRDLSIDDVVRSYTLLYEILE